MKIILDIFSFLIGTSIASFLGVIISRVPEHKSIIRPGSHCDNCKKEIKWYDNIPILSYLLLRGKCRYCKAKIPVSSLILEILGGVLYLICSLMYPFSYHLITYYPIVSVLLLISYIDYYHHYIYDATQILLALLAIIDITIKSILDKEIPIDNFIGLAIGFTFFLLLKIISEKILKKEALGSGDIILIGIIGFHLGYKALLLMLLVSSLSASLIELIRTRKEKNREIAFAPYLCAGYLFSLLFYPMISRFIMEVI